MNKEFVPYTEALELKQLGFDIPSVSGFSYPDSDNLLTQAILYQQAFRWFRDKGYRFNMVNDSENINGYYYYDVWHNGQFMFESHYIYPTYEDTELACLRKLIEIVKNK